MNGYWKEFRTSYMKVYLYRGCGSCSSELGRESSIRKEVPSRQEVLTCLSYEHFHKEGSDTRLDFQSVFGTNLYLSAGRIHDLYQEPTQDVQNWVNFSLLLEEMDFKLAYIIRTYI